MKRYEGLFILNTAGREDGIKETIDRLTADIAEAGGKVETTQKMDKRPFSRVADRRFTSGFYVNIIFAGNPESLPPLKQKFLLSEDVFRVMFTEAPEPVAAK